MESSDDEKKPNLTSSSENGDEERQKNFNDSDFELTEDTEEIPVKKT